MVLTDWSLPAKPLWEEWEKNTSASSLSASSLPINNDTSQKKCLRAVVNRSERCGQPHYFQVWKDLTLRNGDLEPILDLDHLARRQKHPKHGITESPWPFWKKFEQLAQQQFIEHSKPQRLSRQSKNPYW